MHAGEPAIALIGLMGAGKSAIARRLAERLGAPVADLDAMLEAETGHSVAAQFAGEGEDAFRRRESRILAQALDAGARVIACGGGVVIDPANRALLRGRCRVVWLEVSPAEAARRIAGEPGVRPLLAGADPVARLAALARERAPHYEATAHCRVPTDGRDPDAVADAVLAAVRERAA
jgi:shikimate kinase